MKPDQVLENDELLNELTSKVLTVIEKFKNKKIRAYFREKDLGETCELVADFVKNDETTSVRKIAKCLKDWYIQECAAEQESLDDSEY